MHGLAVPRLLEPLVRYIVNVHCIDRDDYIYRVKTIAIIGGGFAGLVAAISTVRELDALGVGSDEVKVTLINRDPFTCIRVRNYERDLSEVRVPLDDMLGPAGVERVEGGKSARWMRRAGE